MNNHQYSAFLKPTSDLWVRRFIATASVGVATFFILWGFSTAESSSKKKVENIEFNPPVQLAIQNNGETTRALMQMAIGLVAVLGGVLVAARDEARLLLGWKPECLMFVLCAGLLLASLYQFMRYSDTLSDACASAIEKPSKASSDIRDQKSKTDHDKDEPKDSMDSKYVIPDVFGARIDSAYILQKAFFISGVAVMLLMFISAHEFGRNDL